jgi:hypothetical protein
MGMDVHLLRIAWGTRLIQLSGYYACHDLKALVAQLCREDVLVYPDVRSWLEVSPEPSAIIHQ